MVALINCAHLNIHSMSNSSYFSRDSVYPKYFDLAGPRTFLESNCKDAYFDREHEFSFGPHNLSDALKVKSTFAKVESMASPMTVTSFGPETTASPFIAHSPPRPESAASNYRTPEGSRSDYVFYTTRKSVYSLRETECRRLTSIGASPYRIPGGSTSGKKKSRRTPKLVESNAKQSEEVLVQSLKKALFLDDDTSSQIDGKSQPCRLEPIQEKENSPQKSEKSIIMNVTQDSNDYSMELLTVSQDIVSECHQQEKDKDEKEVKEKKIVPVVNDNNAVKPNVPEVSISPQSISSDEGFSKLIGGCNSDSGWTDVEDENVSGTSKLSEKHCKRPLGRESFDKSSASLASTVKKVDPQKRLHLLSYTSPPRNKYRSLAELCKDFETKFRVYSPFNPKAPKVKWTPTKPVSPKLLACKRNRPLTCVSHKEQEENIALSIKKNTFKATPFDKKTYHSTVKVGVKRVDPMSTTKPTPFSFQSDERIEARKSRVSVDLFCKLTSTSKKTK